LHKINSNVVVDNKSLTIKDLSRKHNIPESEIEKSREGCCDSKKKKNHRLFMNMIADGDRIESYYDTVISYCNEPYYILTDIDLLFRKKLNKLFFENVVKYDVGLKLRVGKKTGKIPKRINTEGKLKSGLINISTVTINNNDNGINFLKS
jgi:hypothetical protein